jgi:hypothetical protein
MEIKKRSTSTILIRLNVLLLGFEHRVTSTGRLVSMPWARQHRAREGGHIMRLGISQQGRVVILTATHVDPQFVMLALQCSPELLPSIFSSTRIQDNGKIALQACRKLHWQRTGCPFVTPPYDYDHNLLTLRDIHHD